MSDFDIRGCYASIANQAITRACEAFEIHGEFKDFDEAFDVVREEYNELSHEFDNLLMPMSSSALQEKFLNLAYQESIDLAVVSIRNAHLCLTRMKNTSTVTETPGNPKLSDVIMGDEQ